MTDTSTPTLHPAEVKLGESWVLFNAFTRRGIYLGVVGAPDPPYGRVWEAIPVIFPGLTRLSRCPPAKLRGHVSRDAAARALARHWWWLPL